MINGIQPFFNKKFAYNSGLVGYWRFTEMSGDRAKCLITDQPAIFSGYTSGKSYWYGGNLGHGMQGDHTGSGNAAGKCSLTSSTGLITTNGTISVWFKVDYIGYNTCLWSQDKAQALSSTPYIKIWVDTSGYLNARIGSNTSGRVATMSSTLTTGVLYNATVTINGTGSSSTITIFLNGVTTGASATGSHGNINTTPMYTGFGCDVNHYGSNIIQWPLIGSLAEVRVWNRELSADEIKALYLDKLYGLRPDRQMRALMMYMASAPTGYSYAYWF